MAKMPKEIIDLLDDAGSIKTMATCSPEGGINVVPIGSLRAIDEETLAFAGIFEGRTMDNIKKTKKVACLVIQMGPQGAKGYQIKGEFKGFEEKGLLFDRFAKAIKEKLNLGIKGVGLIKVDGVYGVVPPKGGEKIA